MSAAELGKVHWSASLGGEEAHASIGVQVVEAEGGPVVRLVTTSVCAHGINTNNFTLNSGADAWLRNALGDAMSFLAGLKARRKNAEVKP